MDKDLFLNETSPLLINEIEREIKIKQIEFPKYIWFLIINQLSLEDVCTMSLLNKKFNELVNNNSLIWSTLTEKYKDKLVENRKEYNRENLINGYPEFLYQWDIMKSSYHFVENLNSEKYCEEKKEFIKKKLANKGSNALDSNSKSVMQSMKRWEMLIERHIFSIPFFILITFILLQLKMLAGFNKIKFTFCLIPWLMVGVVYIIQFVFYVYHSTKKWSHLFFWNSVFPKKSTCFFFLPIISLTVFFVLLGLKLDEFKINWNLVASFLHLCLFFFLIFFITLQMNSPNKTEPTFIILYLLLSNFIAFAVMFHLSVAGVLNQEKKWIYTMIPVLIVDGFVLFFLFFLFSVFHWYDKSEVILNILIIIGFLCFIAAIVLLFLHLLINIPSFIFFALFDASLFCLCAVDMMIIFDCA